MTDTDTILDQIGSALTAVQEIKSSLVTNQAVPVLTQQREGREALEVGGVP